MDVCEVPDTHLAERNVLLSLSSSLATWTVFPSIRRNGTLTPKSPSQQVKGGLSSRLHSTLQALRVYKQPAYIASDHNLIGDFHHWLTFTPL
jgi:hypothetical protein